MTDTIVRKVATKHTCHWPGCKKPVPPRLWGCKRHWFRLPKSIRDEIWNQYQPGQELRKDPSLEYLQAVHAAHQYAIDNPD